MIIWRNLEPRELAQLLIRASQVWTARRSAGRSRSGRDGGLNQPTPSSRHGGGSGVGRSNGDV